MEPTTTYKCDIYSQPNCNLVQIDRWRREHPSDEDLQPEIVITKIISPFFEGSTDHRLAPEKIRAVPTLGQLVQRGEFIDRVEWRRQNWGCYHWMYDRQDGDEDRAFLGEWTNCSCRFLSLGGPSIPLIKRLAAQTGLFIEYKYSWKNPEEFEDIGELIVDPINRQFKNREGHNRFTVSEVESFVEISLIEE